MVTDTDCWVESGAYPGYLISSDGKVFSTKRNRLLTPQEGKTGYRRVMLSVNGERSFVKVARLVAFAFVKKKVGLPQVDHINGIRNDDRAENLRWVTGATNLREWPSSKLNWLKAEEIKNLHSLGLSFSKIGKKFGIHASTAHEVASGQIWNKSVQ